MRKAFIILLSVFLAFSLYSNLTLAQDSCLYFFYGQGCPHCGEVKPFLEQI